MSQQIDMRVLDQVVSDVVGINLRGEKPLSGFMAKRIREEGKLVEAGLEFRKEDGLYTQLYCSFAVLTRDMYHYPGIENRTDARNFMNLINAVHDEEKAIYGENAFPSYSVVSDEIFPLDLASADRGNPVDLTFLSDPRIIHEWNFKPGKRLLVKLSQRIDLREAVCNTVGPRNFVKKLEKCVEGKAVEMVAVAILTTTFSAAAFWYPLAAYAAIFILNQAYSSYCPE